MIDSVVILAALGLWVCGMWVFPYCSDSIHCCCQEPETHYLHETTADVLPMQKEESNVELVEIQQCSDDDDVQLLTEHSFPIARLVDRHDRRLNHTHMN